LNGRIRRNMMDTRRAVSFMMRSKMTGGSLVAANSRDIDSLDAHGLLFDKINFWMDAVGFININ
jgi:magnesium transporter